MNEITKIHLGRQAFTIAVDAHKELQDYLRAIKRHMGDTDEAVEEVELRMAELLIERGIHGDKVVLSKDVDYLKEQLGEPDDFGDEETEKTKEGKDTTRRLFRDTENALLAGVAAGIGKYLGIDPLWIRLAFIALVFAGGSGILIYIILWLIVPEAKTSSERLQMQGKPVTVDALKDVVERADVEGAAKRATNVVGKAVQGVLKVVIGLAGVALMLTGIGALLGLTTASVYWALNHDFVPGGIFPVGGSEVLLVGLAILAAAIVAFFFVVTGQAMVNRKWPLPGWLLGAIVAVFLASLAVGGALVADVVPKIRARYEASQHTYTRTVPEFTKLRVIGNFESSIRYEESPDRAIVIKYWGDADMSNMVTDVKDKTLTVDSRVLSESIRCRKLCIFHSPVIEVVIQGPKLQELTTDMEGSQIEIPGVNNQTLKVRAQGSSVYFPDFTADTFKAERTQDGTWMLVFAGDYRSSYLSQKVWLFDDTATIAAKDIDLKFDGKCGFRADLDTSAYINLNTWFEKLTLNGQVVGKISDLRALQDRAGRSPYKCLNAPQASMSNEPAAEYTNDNL